MQIFLLKLMQTSRNQLCFFPGYTQCHP